jgi:hypothetical protein
MTMFQDALSDDTLFNTSGHPNPVFDYLTRFVPRRHKELLQWCEYLVYNSAHIYGLLKKFGEYPITSLVYDTSEPRERERHRELYEEKLNLKGFLTKISFDKYTYGCSLFSIYEPFQRWLRCRSCGTVENAAVAQVTYDLKRDTFSNTCRKCGVRGEVIVEETHLKNPADINLIRWDPKLIDIDYNPVTGKSEYYYTIPERLKEMVRENITDVLATTPRGMLRAIGRNSLFKFAPNKIYHIKMPGPAGVDAQWGLPPLVSAIKLFLFASTLRRANEAIALEYLTPFRVMFPQATAGADPFSALNLASWRNEIQTQYKQFRRDPLHLMFAPVPIGVQNIGGEGRALMTLGELQEAERAMVLALGVPMEFVTGGLGQTRGEVTLRMLENQLQTHIEDLNGAIQWIENNVSKFLGWKTIPMRLANFRLLDDVENKQMLLQLWQAGKVSDTKIGETFNIDFEQERKQRYEDQLAEIKAEQEFNARKTKLLNSLSQQAMAQAQAMQTGGTYDNQQLYAQAAQIAQEYAALDPGQRQSRLDALDSEDHTMYLWVKDLLEQMKLNENQARKTEG